MPDSNWSPAHICSVTFYYAQLARLIAYGPRILPDADEDFHRVTGGSYSTVGPDGHVAFHPELAREGAPFDPHDASLLAGATVSAVTSVPPGMWGSP